MKEKLASSSTMIFAGMAFTALLLVFVSFTKSDSNPQPEKSSQNITQYVAPSTPDKVTFAGETIPTDIIDVREKLDRELIVNSYWHSNTFLMIKRANRWFPVIEPILAKNGVPDDFKYLALIESGLTNAVSPAGATGFWQFLKSTGQSYGLEITSEVDERYHVEKSTEAACQYLRDAYEKYHSWSLVAASYNMGMGGVNKALERQRVDSYWDLLLNSETARYVYRIAAVKQIISDPEAYGFIVGEQDLYSPYETHLLEVNSPIANLADYAKEQGINYKIIKTLNPWLRSTKLTAVSGKEYALKIPNNLEFKE